MAKIYSRKSQANRRPLVSVIVTTKNEESVIERLLSSVYGQSYKPIEVIVVDNNSSDLTKNIAKKIGAKVYNFGPERSSQRNYGAAKSHGEYLIFLDADMEVTQNVIGDCVEAASVNRADAVVIPEKSIATNYWEKCKSFERSFYNLSGDSITDAARFFSREAFEKAGGYDETITGPEDWDLPENIIKLGYKKARIKTVIFHYERIGNPFMIARKKYYYALKTDRYLKKNKISIVSAKTVYFLRPVFYRNWKRLIKHPILSSGMILMLSLELIYGGLGYLAGRIIKQ